MSGAMGAIGGRFQNPIPPYKNSIPPLAQISTAHCQGLIVATQPWTNEEEVITCKNHTDTGLGAYE